MKKLLTLGLLITTLLGINSCAEKGCTDKSAPNYNPSAKSDNGTCTDLTANIVGAYNGAYLDSTIDGSLPTLYNSAAQITVTKIDDSHVQIVTAGGVDFTVNFTASISLLTNGNYLLQVPAQTSGGYAIAPYNLTVSGFTASGAYTTAARSLYIGEITTGTDIEEFQGTH
jgi:hypothetical protein